MIAFVVAGGSVSQSLLKRELQKADFIVCADRGAEHLETSDRLPDLLVGDMDSIDAALLTRMEASGVEILQVAAEKDETDAQLALDEAIRRGATEIVLLGALGGRLDHALGNLTLLLRAEKRGVHALILDEGCEVRAATGEYEIIGKVGETVSLLPVGPGVSVRYLDGLKYGTREPLELPVDSPVGVSNLMRGKLAHLSIEGWVYIVKIRSN